MEVTHRTSRLGAGTSTLRTGGEGEGGGVTIDITLMPGLGLLVV